MEITSKDAVKKLREEFDKYRDVKDVRVIDLLCVKVKNKDGVTVCNKVPFALQKCICTEIYDMRH